jgi:PAS domain S-box-containing protein
MKIGRQILLALLAISFLVALMAANAVRRQLDLVLVGVTKEATDLANVLGVLISRDPHASSNSPQEIVETLHRTQKRDVVVVDRDQMILADAVPGEVGRPFEEDDRDEVGLTIRDGKVRNFTEVSNAYPNGIEQIVVPIREPSGAISGALVLEYTPLYNEMLALTRTSMAEVVASGLLGVLVSVGIGLSLGRSIAWPLQQLTRAAAEFAAGRADLPLPPARSDEIGELILSFEDMVRKRRMAESALETLRDELEVRVQERTSELAAANAALHQENSERKLVEVALQRKQSELRVLFDLIPAMIWFKDCQNRILRANQRAADAAGMSVEQLESGRAPMDSAVPLGSDSDDSQVVTSGQPRLGVVEQLHLADGRELWVETDKVPYFDGEGRVIGIIVMSQDITARKSFEARLLQSQKMETVGKLAGGVAHEFNSILTAIIGQSELMIQDLPPESPEGNSAREIRKAAERAAVLTHQLLAYGRKQLLKPEVLNLNSILAGLEGTLRHLMGRGCQVRMVLASDLRRIRADAGQIEQVVVNIAMNAADAMPNGGILTVETANITLDDTYVSGIPDLTPGEYVRLAIADTGIGLTQEVKARIFEPFFTTKKVGEGTGLGLATAYGIVKQSGGHIGVYSEPARGTAFSIYLPQVPEARPESLSTLKGMDLPRGTETILLVEDDPGLRDMSTTLLRKLGYTVWPTANGVEALSIKQQKGVGHIDLLFTDVVMPQMGGPELADRIRAISPQVKVLFTSAYSEVAIVHQGSGLQSGAALLQKPFTPLALAQRVRAALDQKTETSPHEQ